MNEYGADQPLRLIANIQLQWAEWRHQDQQSGAQSSGDEQIPNGMASGWSRSWLARSASRPAVPSWGQCRESLSTHACKRNGWFMESADGIKTPPTGPLMTGCSLKQTIPGASRSSIDSKLRSIKALNGSAKTRGHWFSKSLNYNKDSARPEHNHQYPWKCNTGTNQITKVWQIAIKLPSPGKG